MFSSTSKIYFIKRRHSSRNLIEPRFCLKLVLTFWFGPCSVCFHLHVLQPAQREWRRLKRSQNYSPGIWNHNRLVSADLHTLGRSWLRVWTWNTKWCHHFIQEQGLAPFMEIVLPKSSFCPVSSSSLWHLVHKPCVEFTAFAGGGRGASVSAVSVGERSISNAETCSHLSSVGSEDGTMSTGSFSFFLFWIRFFFDSNVKYWEKTMCISNTALFST